jgi:hypothetical protein
LEKYYICSDCVLIGRFYSEDEIIRVESSVSDILKEYGYRYYCRHCFERKKKENEKRSEGRKKVRHSIEIGEGITTWEEDEGEYSEE